MRCSLVEMDCGTCEVDPFASLGPLVDSCYNLCSSLEGKRSAKKYLNVVFG